MSTVHSFTCRSVTPELPRVDVSRVSRLAMPELPRIDMRLLTPELQVFRSATPELPRIDVCKGFRSLTPELLSGSAKPELHGQIFGIPTGMFIGAGGYIYDCQVLAAREKRTFIEYTQQVTRDLHTKCCDYHGCQCSQKHNDDYRARFALPVNPSITSRRFFLHEEIAATLPECIGQEEYTLSEIVEVDRCIEALPKFPRRAICLA